MKRPRVQAVNTERIFGVIVSEKFFATKFYGAVFWS